MMLNMTAQSITLTKPAVRALHQYFSLAHFLFRIGVSV